MEVETYKSICFKKDTEDPEILQEKRIKKCWFCGGAFKSTKCYSICEETGEPDIDYKENNTFKAHCRSTGRFRGLEHIETSLSIHTEIIPQLLRTYLSVNC